MVTYYKDKNLPNRFKECRIAMKLTQPQLSSLLGFKGGKATIMSYEKSKRLPNVNTIIRMHEVLKVSTDYLLCIDDYKDHNDSPARRDTDPDLRSRKVFSFSLTYLHPLTFHDKFTLIILYNVAKRKGFGKSYLPKPCLNGIKF